MNMVLCQVIVRSCQLYRHGDQLEDCSLSRPWQTLILWILWPVAGAVGPGKRW